MSYEKDYIVKKTMFEKSRRWQPGEIIPLTTKRAEALGIPKYVIPVGYKEHKNVVKNIIDRTKRSIKEVVVNKQSQKASKTILDKLVPGVE